MSPRDINLAAAARSGRKIKHLPAIDAILPLLFACRFVTLESFSFWLRIALPCRARVEGIRNPLCGWNLNVFRRSPTDLFTTLLCRVGG